MPTWSTTLLMSRSRSIRSCAASLTMSSARVCRAGGRSGRISSGISPGTRTASASSPRSRADVQAEAARLRAADLLRPQLGRGQEDHVARRLPRQLRALPRSSQPLSRTDHRTVDMTRAVGVDALRIRENSGGIDRAGEVVGVAIHAIAVRLACAQVVCGSFDVAVEISGRKRRFVARGCDEHAADSLCRPDAAELRGGGVFGRGDGDDAVDVVSPGESEQRLWRWELGVAVEVEGAYDGVAVEWCERRSVDDERVQVAASESEAEAVLRLPDHGVAGVAVGEYGQRFVGV